MRVHAREEREQARPPALVRVVERARLAEVGERVVEVEHEQRLACA